MALRFLVGNMQTQHGRAEKVRRIWAATAPSEEPRTYRMDLPTAGGVRNCLVEGCPGRAVTRTSMWVHFLHRHVWDTVFILEEVNLSHPP